MSLKKLVISFLVIITIVCCPISALAYDITLDGKFYDWFDKPQLSDPVGDEGMINDCDMVKWYPDTVRGNLYLYSERVPNRNRYYYNNRITSADIAIYNNLFGNSFNYNKSYNNWLVKYYISGDMGNMKLFAMYLPANRNVYIILFDNNNSVIWFTYGKWGEGGNPGRQIEFYIPLDMLVSSVQSGFQIEMYLQSGYDRVPDSGTITISTISTFPVQSSALMAVFVTGALLYAGLKRKKLPRGGL